MCFGQDTKNKFIPHKATTYYLITSAWSVYCSFTQLFVIFIAFGQLDLLLVRLASDLTANYCTLSLYLHGKIYDPQMHARNSHAEETEVIMMQDLSANDEHTDINNQNEDGISNMMSEVDDNRAGKQENTHLLP